MMQAETASMSFAARERSPCSMLAAAALVLASVGADLVLPGWSLLAAILTSLHEDPEQVQKFIASPIPLNLFDSPRPQRLSPHRLIATSRMRFGHDRKEVEKKILRFLAA